MSQATVLELLKKEKKPLSTKEIAKKLGMSTSTASCNIRRLREQQLIKVLKVIGYYRTTKYFV